MVKAKCSLWINSAVIGVLLLRSVAIEWGRPYQSYVAGALHDECWFARTEKTYILVPALSLTLKKIPKPAFPARRQYTPCRLRGTAFASIAGRPSFCDRSDRRERLKDEVYRQMFHLERRRPGAELALAIALLRAWIASDSDAEMPKSREWLMKICPICIHMIEEALKVSDTERQCIQ